MNECSSYLTQLANGIINSDMKSLIDRHELYIRLRGLSMIHEAAFQITLKELKRRSKFKP